MKIHPICEKMPWMSPAELQELADDIRARGQIDPIYRLRGEIIDGKNRIRACELAGIEPIIEDVNVSNVAAFIRSKGIFRRHLTDSQRAMLAAELCGLAAGRPSKKAVRGQLARLSIAKAAKKLKVKIKTLKRARKVIDHAAKPIQQQVINGQVSIAAAATVAVLPKPEQRSLAAAGPEAVRDKAAEMRAPWPAEPKPTIARNEEGNGTGTVARILKALDKWWAAEKRNLCSYPPAAPQRIFDLVRAEIARQA